MRALGAMLSVTGLPARGTRSSEGETPQSPVPESDTHTLTALERIAPGLSALRRTSPGEPTATDADPSAPVWAPPTVALAVGVPVLPAVAVPWSASPVRARAGPFNRSRSCE